MKELRKILIGIDKDQCEDDNGWWETSSGAEFGAKKLKEVEALVKKLTIPIVGVTLCNCDDKAVKHFIKNWCEDCEKNIV